MFKEYVQRTDKLNERVKLKFTDYSDENGFEFGFACDRCGYEWRSERIQFKLNGFSENLDKMDIELLWNEEKRKLFDMIINEAVIEFNKCPDCGAWVCDDCFFVDEGEVTDYCKECIEEFKH